MNNGAVVILFNEIGFSPLRLVCANGHDSNVQQLINNSAEMNLCDKEGFSPLHLVCADGHDSIVQQLINNSAEVNLCNKNGFSPLQVACYNQNMLIPNIRNCPLLNSLNHRCLSMSYS